MKTDARHELASTIPNCDELQRLDEVRKHHVFQRFPHHLADDALIGFYRAASFQLAQSQNVCAAFGKGDRALKGCYYFCY
jgi:hypothetical protein